MHIPVSHGRLEANLRPADEPVRGIAVLCHPHPQHGGTMNTKAVYRSAQALAETGFHVLRFNFRGVGASTGSFGDGIGEEEDTEAALEWMAQAHPGLPALLGGFSFGSRIALAIGVRDEKVRGLLAFGLPLSLDAFDFLAGVAKPLLVVQGENDEYGSGEEVHAFLQRMAGATTLVRVAGSDHYFHEHFEELQGALRDYFRDGPGAGAFPPR